MEPSSNALLQVEHLKQYFTIGKGKTVKAVDDISFAIRRGETFGLVGESGCGKSTTAAAFWVSPVLPPERFFMNGADISTFNKAQRLPF